jgi:hypothetical protein
VEWKVTMPCVDSILGMYNIPQLDGDILILGRFFYKHELLAKYEWYWRLEPEIKYFCDIT